MGVFLTKLFVYDGFIYNVILMVFVDYTTVLTLSVHLLTEMKDRVTESKGRTIHPYLLRTGVMSSPHLVFLVSYLKKLGKPD